MLKVSQELLHLRFRNLVQTLAIWLVVSCKTESALSCLSFPVCIHFSFPLIKFFGKDFSETTAPRSLKFGTNIGYDLLYCVRENQYPHAYTPGIQSIRVYIVFIFSVTMFVSVCVNLFFSSKISQELLHLGFRNLVETLAMICCIV